LNNSVSYSTGQTPTELMYGFRVREGLNELGAETTQTHQDIIRMRAVYRQQAMEAIDFNNASAKWRYDQSHRPLEMNPGGYIFLRLHKGYTLRSKDATKINTKLGVQRVGPFRIKQRIGRNVYELKIDDEIGQIPTDWRIHPVISIQQLEPAPDLTQPDEFGRPQPSHPAPVETIGEHEIERINRKRINKKGKPEYELV
jgi:hypothetical protein